MTEYIVTRNKKNLFSSSHLSKAMTAACAMVTRWPNQTIRLMERERHNVWFTTIKVWPATQVSP